MQTTPQPPRAEDTDRPSATVALSRRRRWLVIAAALLALFLGALDALIMSAAMPTIVSELGGMQLYSWVYSAYFLARAVSLPVFGKLADVFKARGLFVFSIAVFLAASVLAGASTCMEFLIAARVLQGVGAGGNFALVYIVLADMSPPEKRGQTLSFASSIWGIASVLGPTLGGFIVTYFSWRWVFLINVPLALASLLGVGFYLVEIRTKKERAALDIAGALTLTLTILSFLTLFLLGGRTYAWGSLPIGALGLLTMAAGVVFVQLEKRAADPIICLDFFRIRGFRIGNAAVFLSSFAIFSLFAFAPLFIQGALGKSPMQVGTAMLSLSLGWSAGSLLLGQVVERMGKRNAALVGAAVLTLGCLMTLDFGVDTSLAMCFAVFLLVGLGMGFVTLATLLVVQNSLAISELGVATSSHQFARTLGGTVGIGICGSLVTANLGETLAGLGGETGGAGLSAALAKHLQSNVEDLFTREIQMQLSGPVHQILQDAVVHGVASVFWMVAGAAGLCLLLCLMLPGRRAFRTRSGGA
jgi:EmrB/QacA subfamily drug resistance transporter